jgi:hypothetical protein
MSNRDLHATLFAIFTLSKANSHIDASSVGRMTGLCATETATAFLELECIGLIDASRARLTMKGLVVALSSSGGIAGCRLERDRAPQQQPAALPLGLAARPKGYPCAAFRSRTSLNRSRLLAQAALGAAVA